MSGNALDHVMAGRQTTPLFPHYLAILLTRVSKIAKYLESDPGTPVTGEPSGLKGIPTCQMRSALYRDRSQQSSELARPLDRHGTAFNHVPSSRAIQQQDRRDRDTPLAYECGSSGATAMRRAWCSAPKRSHALEPVRHHACSRGRYGCLSARTEDRPFRRLPTRPRPTWPPSARAGGEVHA